MAFKRQQTTRPVWRGTAILLACTLLTMPVVAADQDAEMRANALYKDAKERFDAGDLPKALAVVKDAEAIFAHPAIVFLRARVLHKLARLREADEAIRRVNAETLPKALQKPLEDERQAIADDLRAKGELLLTVDPATAQVLLDGAEVRAENIAWLNPGKHKLDVRAAGYEPLKRDIVLAAGETLSQTLRLVPMAGSVVVIVPGGLRDAEVRLDGLLIALTEGQKVGDRTPPQPVEAGPHHIVCSRGTEESAHDVEVTSSGAAVVTCTEIAPPTGTARTVLGWTGVAAGAGLVGAGAYGILSFLLVDAKDPRYGDPRYEVSHNKIIFGSTYAALGVAVGVCSWLFLLRDSKPAESGR